MRAPPHADIIFEGGSVWSGVAGATPARAVAVRDDRIVAVGSQSEVAAMAGPATRHIGIGQGLLLPAFVDAHCHPLWGGLAELACDLSGADTTEAWLRAVAAYAAEHPTLEVIAGEGWNPYPFPGGLPRREQLDAVVADRPVILISRDGHSTWVNTSAIRTAGIDRATPDPPNGHIVRDEDGEPSGVFHEAAKAMVECLVPEPDAEQQAEGLRRGQTYLHRHGIGSWLDAIVDPEAQAVYLDAADRGELTGRVLLCLRWDPERGLEQVDELLARRREIEARRHPLVQATAVKLFADGVIESSTARLLQPYEDDSATDPSRRGAAIYPPAVLRQVCDAIDAAGFDVHAHAIGDGAVREVLDALEATRRLDRPREPRHAIAHLELVDDEDIPRFGALGVIAACQPLWAVHDEVDTILSQRLGPERLERRYPFGRLRDAGALLAMGSDWNVSTADPLAIMQVALRRVPPGADDAHPLGPPGERLQLEEALTAYTSGSARVLRLERQTGTIEIGKAADLVLLEADPFRPGVELTACRVRLTMVAGRIVYEA